ncbi:hypothetical protein AVEN_223779-1 [Araneus ventricosus]|uniref:Uncharacterized protein n=1 Tax=Araneus ventricosus TaxID=182803 RepID=A0A4Y2DM27_ARAVE|nr:hypothetical protein AVEN_223779-1 [Araneus ventricosus]
MGPYWSPRHRQIPPRPLLCSSSEAKVEIESPTAGNENRKQALEGLRRGSDFLKGPLHFPSCAPLTTRPATSLCGRRLLAVSPPLSFADTAPSLVILRQPVFAILFK